MKTLSETQPRLNRNVWLRDCEWVSGQDRPDKITSLTLSRLRDLLCEQTLLKLLKWPQRRLQDDFIPKEFNLNEFIFDFHFRMQRISHLLFVWLTGGAVNISEHPRRPASASSAWRPGPSPWPAWPSWSPGWRRSAGARRTSASSPGCDIRTTMLKLQVYLQYWIFEKLTFIALDSVQGRREKRFLTAVLIMMWSGCLTLREWGNLLRMQLRLILREWWNFRYECFFLSFQSTENWDCRQLTALQLGRLSSPRVSWHHPIHWHWQLLTQPRTPGRRKFNLMLKHWNRDLR